MGLKGKIQMLLDREKRLRRSYERQRRDRNQRRGFPLTAEALLGRLDREKLDAILSLQGTPDPGEHTVKYLDMEKWLATNIRRVLNLGLDFQMPKRVLDLGSGAGYFLYTCKQVGHDALGLDVNDPSAAWYGKMFDLYGVPRVIWYINPFEPLPDLGAKFDYVTGFMVCFNQPKTENAWKIEEWRFFLDDLWKRLKPGAVVWFELNPRLDGTHYSPELKSFFESRGAIVDGKRLVWGLDQTEYAVLQKLGSLESAALRKSGEVPAGAQSL